MKYLEGEYKVRGEYHKHLDKNWNFYPIYKIKMKIIERYVTSLGANKTILDAGCGEGVLVKKFKSQGLKIIGIDYNVASPFVIKGDIVRLPFKKDSFDYILCLDVIEHFIYNHQEMIINELYRVLKNNGVIVFSIPNLAHLYSRISFLISGSFFRTSNIEKHPGDRPISEYIALLKEKKITIERRIGIFPTYPLFYNLYEFLGARRMGWIVNLLQPFAYADFSFLNIIFCRKQHL